MDATQLNAAAKQWVAQTQSKLKSTAKGLGIVHRDNSPSDKSSVEAIKGAIKNKFGVAHRISFKFPRHMIFVHKGLGRDTPIGKQGSTNRKAKEWFEPVIEERIDSLADSVAEHTANEVVARINF